MAVGVSRDAVASAERMLADAYELVLNGWCQGATAQDEGGRSIKPASAFARRWSAPGALERIWRRARGDEDDALAAYQRACLALAATVRDLPQRWNDVPGRRLDEVLDAVAMAIHALSPLPDPQLAVTDRFVEEVHYGDGPDPFLIG